ncbi:MAG: hypothetical protein Q9186_005265 [Xanthomendoza sp. 1 TL-2023]
MHYASLFVIKFDIEPMRRVSPFSWLRCGLSTYTGAANIPQLFAGNVAQAYFAHYFFIPEMMAVAQAQYGKHLVILRKALDSPNIVNTNHLVQGMMLVVLFEMLNSTSPNAWTMHTGALASIIEGYEQPRLSTSGASRLLWVNKLISHQKD